MSPPTKTQQPVAPLSGRRMGLPNDAPSDCDPVTATAFLNASTS